MFERIQRRFGTAGLIVAVVALVAALGGSAVALTGSEKKEVKKFSKSFSKKFSKNFSKNFSKQFAKVGPAGPQGLPGANGTNGTNGKDGVGTNGTNGVSVTSSSLDPGEGGCVEGGVEYTSVSGTDVVCNGEEGEEGSPWTAGGTLPSEETLTGAWVADRITGNPGSPTFSPLGTASVPISFNIPLPSHIDQPNARIVPVGGPAPTGCTGGTAANPTADPGNICVYATAFVNADFASVLTGVSGLSIQKVAAGGSNAFGASRTGARLLIQGNASASPTAPGSGYGTWAVTAP